MSKKGTEGIEAVMELVIATNNRHKLEEISAILSDLPVRTIPLSDFPDLPELREDGRTYAENALQKARTVARFTRHWSLGDDTGLEVEALGGEPGLYSARYAGEGVTFEQNRRKLLSELEGVPRERRKAVFRCVMALVGPSGEEVLFEGTIPGYISDADQGTGGFGYDAIFYLPDRKKTFAELDPAEKNQISHRARALKRVRDHLKNLITA
jgi:XTP/dITP diphosphohydrolase